MRENEGRKKEDGRRGNERGKGGESLFINPYTKEKKYKKRKRFG